MQMKKKLAFEIVKLLWGEESAKKGEEAFAKTFQKGEASFDTEIELKENLISTIAPYTAMKSSSDAKRLVAGSAIEVNGETVTDINFEVKKGDKIKIGKKVFGTIK
jgi:tyrosyl-tRNA synthetase